METKDILLLIAGAFIGLVINYFTQFTSAPLAGKFGDWRNKQAQKRAIRTVEEAKERISKIENELTVVKWFVENPTSFNALAFDAIQELILKLILIVILGLSMLLLDFDLRIRILFALLLFLIWFLRTSSLDRYNKVEHIFRKVRNFQSFEDQMRRQIVELREVVNRQD